MQRRGFLTTAALGTGAVAVGCGAAHAVPELAETEGRALAARLERGLRLLHDQPFGSMVRGEPATRPDLTEQVLRLSIESLLVLDVLREIPDGARIPHALAEVLAPSMPRLDRAVHTHHALLSRMPEARRREVDEHLRTRPERPMEIAEWLDGYAAHLDIPTDNRLRLRQSAVTVGTRLRRQSTNAVVADCVTKLDEVFARQGTTLPSELATQTATVVDVMWQQVEESSSSGSRTMPQREAPTPLTQPWAERNPLLVPERFGAEREMIGPTEPVQWNDSWARPGDEEQRLGIIMMPLGLVSCGVLLIAGLIVFIAGSVQNGDWDGRTHADDATVE